MLFKWLTFISSYQTSQIKNEECKGEEEIWRNGGKVAAADEGYATNLRREIYSIRPSAQRRSQHRLIQISRRLRNPSRLMSTIWQRCKPISHSLIRFSVIQSLQISLNLCSWPTRAMATAPVCVTRFYYDYIRLKTKCCRISYHKLMVKYDRN